MNKPVIIHPCDESTDFLEAITTLLIKQFGAEHFHYHRIGFHAGSHRECVEFVSSLPDETFVFFMGHGRSDALLGAFSDDFPRELLVTKEQASVFHRKKVFLLACRSEELLREQGISGIGFGNLLTDMGEVNQARELRQNWNAYYNVQPNDIARFRSILVSIVGKSIAKFFIKQMTLEQLHLLLKLHFNKAISKLILSGIPSQNQGLANLLYEAKSQMRLFM
ncbi:MAG: caspase family protein [Bacteroidetes bacterium]|nr:caspase family protein [Bacteroidota bacterium]